MNAKAHSGGATGGLGRKRKMPEAVRIRETAAGRKRNELTARPEFTASAAASRAINLDTLKIEAPGLGG